MSKSRIYKGFRIEVMSSKYVEGAWYARVTLLEDIPEHGLVGNSPVDLWDTPPCETEELADRYGEAMTRRIRLRGFSGGMFKICDGGVLHRGGY